MLVFGGHTSHCTHSLATADAYTTAAEWGAVVAQVADNAVFVFFCMFFHVFGLIFWSFFLWGGVFESTLTGFCLVCYPEQFTTLDK